PEAAVVIVCKNIIAQALLAVQRGPVDTVQMLQRGSAQALEPSAVIFAEIVSQDAVVSVVTAFSGDKRKVRCSFLLIRLEECTERLRRAHSPIICGLSQTQMRRKDH